MGEQPRVLVVDDYEDVADMVALLFRRVGFSTRVCYSAREALDVAQAETFPVVVSDIGMPQMNGYELARALRALPGYEYSALIAITGFSMYDDSERSRAAGFDHHFTKPIEPITFTSFIERLKKEL